MVIYQNNIVPETTKRTVRTAELIMDVPSDIALGIFLNNLLDNLNQILMNARNAGLMLEIEAGREINIAIQNAQNVFSKNLEDAISKLDDSGKLLVGKLTSLVNDLNAGIQSTMADVIARAQQISNSLPFRDHEPQLLRALPRFVVPSISNYEVPVVFQGNFEFAARQDFLPYLLINGKKYPPKDIGTQEITFRVSVDELFPAKAILEKHLCNFTQATLIVPWETSFLGLFPKRHQNQYQVIIGALPQSPGQITVIHKTINKKPYSKRFSAGGYHQASTRESGNKDDIDHPYSVRPEDGYTVVRNTSSLDVAASQGDWSKSFVSDDGNQVVYKVTTIHHGAGSSGSVDFAISFDQIQNIDEPITTSEPVDLVWGDSKSFDYKPGSWTVLFNAFDGSHTEFLGAKKSKFLLIEEQTGGFTIATVDPKTLEFPYV